MTITAANYGQAGGVTETLPAGFSYVRSSLDAAQVSELGNNQVRFTLQGDTSFIYTVTASSTAGPHTFSGTLRDFDRQDTAVGGATDVTVEGPAGPASRSFSPATVTPGGQVTVTITTTDYGQAGGVTETLPAGFSYVRSSLDAAQVSELGNNQVRFTLQGDTSFTYTVTASSAPGAHRFSGTLRDFDRVDHAVGGASVVTVRTSAPPPQVSTAAPPPPATPVPSVPDNLRPLFVGGIEQERSVEEGSAEGADVGDPVAATDRKRRRCDLQPEIGQRCELLRRGQQHGTDNG